MTSKEKSIIHEHLTAYRIGKAIDAVRPHLLQTNDAASTALAKLEGRYEHFTHAARHDYSPLERRHENDDMVKQLQLLLSRIPVVDKPRTLADILGRPYEEEAGKETTQPEPEAATDDDRQGFFGEIVHSGSPSAKRVAFTVDKSYGATYHGCVQTLRAQNVTVESGDRAGGRIQGTTPAAAGARLGERVLLWLTPERRGQTKVTLVVDSQVPDAVFDMGRHQRLLDRLKHQIQYG